MCGELSRLLRQRRVTNKTTKNHPKHAYKLSDQKSALDILKTFAVRRRRGEYRFRFLCMSPCNMHGFCQCWRRCAAADDFTKKEKTPRIFPQHIILPNTTVYSHCRNDFLFKNVLFCSMAATKFFFIENWPLNYELKYFWWRKNERFSLLVVSLSSEPFNLFYSAAIFMCGVRSYFIHISLGHSHIHLHIYMAQ